MAANDNIYDYDQDDDYYPSMETTPSTVDQSTPDHDKETENDDTNETNTNDEDPKIDIEQERSPHHGRSDQRQFVIIGRVKKPSPKRYKSNAKVIRNPAIELYTNEELEYYRSLSRNERIVMSKVEQRMYDLNEEVVPLRFKVLSSNIDEKIKALAVQKLNYLSRADPGGGEYNKTLNYVQAMCRIPFGINKPLAVNASSPREDIRTFLLEVKDALDNKVYGHADAKTHIVRLLAQWIANPQAKGLAIGIQGSAGTGKTRLVKDGICSSLGLPFAFLPLGGASDGSFLEGHSYTYEGATWGKIVDILMKAKCMNPVIFFDELDKVSESVRGEEVVNMLVHLTDATQNDKIHDRYFADLDFDLSRCLMIFSYNDETKINPILYDRLIKIHTNGYTITDKIKISQSHMIPELLSEYNLKTGDIVFTDEIIKLLVQEVDEEQGVRNLRRGLYDVISSINLNNMLCLTEEDSIRFPYTVIDSDFKKYLNHKKDSKNVSHKMMYI